MDPSETFDQIVERLAREHAPIRRRVVERILIEEHDLLVGVPAGDIVPGVVVEATVERIQRLADDAAQGDRAELA